MLALRSERLLITFLAHQAWLMADAIGRTLYRLVVSRRNLLEWVTAAQAQLSSRLGLLGCLSTHERQRRRRLLAALWPSAGWTQPRRGSAAVRDPWIFGTGHRVPDQPSPRRRRSGAAVEPMHSLRLVARRTWRYFETFVTADDNMLPPDNFQEDPQPVARASDFADQYRPLSALCRQRPRLRLDRNARDRRAAGSDARDDGALQRFRGHFYNWYDTRDLRPLEPQYVSSVDSGNLAAHLIALANACREWIDAPDATRAAIAGIEDAVQSRARGAARLPDDRRTQTTHAQSSRRCARRDSQRRSRSRCAAPDRATSRAISRRQRASADLIDARAHWPASRRRPHGDMLFWAEATQRSIESARARCRVTTDAVDML